MPTPEPEREPTQIDIVGEINMGTIYANFARVTVTSLDAVITFAYVDPATVSPGQDGEEGPALTVDAPAVARIVLPHAVLEGLEKAIHAQSAKRRQPEGSSEEG